MFLPGLLNLHKMTFSFQSRTEEMKQRMDMLVFEEVCESVV